MSGWWVASYLSLWILVVVLFLLQIGTLRELGLLRRSVLTGIVKPSESGPPLGAQLPTLTMLPAQGSESVQLGRGTDVMTLLIFLTPLCNGCQSAAELLERFLPLEVSADVAVRVILCGPLDTCRSFLSLYILPAFVTIDEEYALPEKFNVHMYPSALLYDQEGLLVRKGVISSERGLKEVLEGVGISEPLSHRRA